jgi:hypothetical protein
MVLSELGHFLDSNKRKDRHFGKEIRTFLSKLRQYSLADEGEKGESPERVVPSGLSQVAGLGFEPRTSRL